MATNEALAEYLALHHKGEVNAVTSRELECSFQMRGSELRREINALRGDGIPICSFEGGYGSITGTYHLITIYHTDDFYKGNQMRCILIA